MATTTPNYGWDVPTSTDYVADGAVAIETLGDDIDASLFSITGGKNVSYSLIADTTLSGAASVNFENCFSSAYDNYQIYYEVTGTTGGPNSRFNLRNSGTTLTSGYTGTVIFALSSATFATRGSDAFYTFAQGDGDGALCTIFRPFLATRTSWSSVSNQGQAVGIDAGVNINKSSYNSLNWNTTSGTISGRVRIYGIRNS